MTYAFHTPDKLCFILDLMNGGDLHYHLSQVGYSLEPKLYFTIFATKVLVTLLMVSEPIGRSVCLS